MNRSIKTLMLTAALSLATTAALAQHAPSATATPGIDQVRLQQQARIAQGAARGQLTRPEVQRLQHQQAVIHHAERHAMADGVVTRAERQRLHAMQARASRAIHHERHDHQYRVRPAGWYGR